MRLALLVLLAVTAAPAAGEIPVRERPLPLPHQGQEWIRTTSPNFTIISSAGADRTREVAQTLETVAAALRRVHPRFDARFADTTVFLFARRGDCQPIFDLLLNQRRVNAPGAFVVQPDGGAAIIVDAGRNAGRTIRHELMHNILATSGTRLPLWLEEGIAEYFSTTIVRGDSVIMGRPIFAHHRSLRVRGVLPIDDVLSARSESPIATDVLFYAQSWALVEWMMRTNRPAFYDFVADVEQGNDVKATFRRHFSMDIGAVARSFRTPMVRPPASNALQIERGEVAISEELIAASDALFELARFLGQLDATRDDAERFLHTALEIEHGHARSLAALGTLRTYETKYEEAEAFFEKALSLSPEDGAIQVAFAEGLLRHAIGPFAGATILDGDSLQRFRRARELAAKALAIRSSPLAEAILGASYLVEDDASPGIEPLEKASAARPARRDFALSLYGLYLRADRRADAERLFSSVFQRSRNAQAVQSARAIYVREHIMKVNRVIRAGRLDDAALVMGQIAEAAPDEEIRAALANQAATLGRIVERNRQVFLYNEAVAALHSEDPEGALKHCDRLLASAIDPDIRERAERLRATLCARLGM
ncbi:MAG: DUF1570 domain-containing protein [Thermoanaerobaculia bacterium]